MTEFRTYKQFKHKDLAPEFRMTGFSKQENDERLEVLANNHSADVGQAYKRKSIVARFLPLEE